jgi:hypothetical protein
VTSICTLGAEGVGVDGGLRKDEGGGRGIRKHKVGEGGRRKENGKGEGGRREREEGGRGKYLPIEMNDKRGPQNLTRPLRLVHNRGREGRRGSRRERREERREEGRGKRRERQTSCAPKSSFHL